MNDMIEKPAIKSVLSSIGFQKAFDIGCGLGTYTAILANHAEHVTACDKSTLMIEHTKRVTSKPNIELLNIDFRDIPSSYYGNYDLVLISLAIIAELDEILNISSRLLKKDGYVLYSHFHPIYGAGKVKISNSGICIGDYWGNRVRVSKNTFGKSKRADYEISWSYYTIEEHIDLIVKNGFYVEKFLEPRPIISDKRFRLIRRASLFPVIIVVLGKKI